MQCIHYYLVVTDYKFAEFVMMFN